jgi:four helix bundle protein
MPKVGAATPSSRPYERLDAWQACHELALVVYRSTRKWPAEERYSLVAQVRRAAVSAATNIAEGTARRGTRELKRFVEIALGSLNELEYLLTLAGEVGVIEAEEQRLLLGFVGRAGQLTGGLHRALRKRAS